MQSVVLQVLQEDKAVAVATAIGVSQTTLHRLREDHLPTLCSMLAHIGLKIVPVEQVTVDPETYRALCHIATKAMARPEIAEALVLGEQ